MVKPPGKPGIAIYFSSTTTKKNKKDTYGPGVNMTWAPQSNSYHELKGGRGGGRGGGREGRTWQHYWRNSWKRKSTACSIQGESPITENTNPKWELGSSGPDRPWRCRAGGVLVWLQIGGCLRTMEMTGGHKSTWWIKQIHELLLSGGHETLLQVSWPQALRAVLQSERVASKCVGGIFGKDYVSHFETSPQRKVI